MGNAQTKIVLIIEYDGTDYCGMQIQAGHPEQPTIQAEIEKAIFRLTGEDLHLLTASRTDTGVHARGQVVSFRTNSVLATANFVSGLNHFLPAPIAVCSAHRAALGLNVQRAAVSREYRYYILNRSSRSPLWYRFAYHVPQPLDVNAMDDACRVLLGEHDFASFTSKVRSQVKTVRHVYHATVKREGEMVIFDITANSFLPHQVRNTVGVLVQVGLGRLSVNDFKALLAARQFSLASQRAPAHGLFLMRVNYTRPFGEEN